MASGLAKFMGGAASAGLDAYKTSRMAELQKQRDNRLQAFKNKSRQEDMWMAKKKMESDAEWRTQQTDYQAAQTERADKNQLRDDNYRIDEQKMKKSLNEIQIKAANHDLTMKEELLELNKLFRETGDQGLKREVLEQINLLDGKMPERDVSEIENEFGGETQFVRENGVLIETITTGEDGVPIIKKFPKTGSVKVDDIVSLEMLPDLVASGRINMADARRLKGQFAKKHPAAYKIWEAKQAAGPEEETETEPPADSATSTDIAASTDPAAPATRVRSARSGVPGKGIDFPDGSPASPLARRGGLVAGAANRARESNLAIFAEAFGPRTLASN